MLSRSSAARRLACLVLASLLLGALLPNAVAPMSGGTVAFAAPAPAPVASPGTPPADFVPAPLRSAAIPTALNPAALAAPRPEFSRLPLSFIPNAGQTDPAVRFQANGPGSSVFFTAQEVVFALTSAPPAVTSAVPLTATTAISMSVVRLRFDGANAAPAVSGAARLPGSVNYFIGSDPAQWHTDLPTYAGIDYRQLYSGIDLHYDGTDGVLKGTYTVAPGADASQLRWRYVGATGVRVDIAGNLIVTIPAPALTATPSLTATLVEHAPRAWQTIGGRQVPVSVQYALALDGSIGFTLGAYNAAQPLTIDPTLTYSTYLGGSSSDAGYGIAVDRFGNRYLTGETFSAPFPPFTSGQGPGGSLDAYVAKLNAAGTALLYSVYIGGSSSDRGWGIVVDRDGNATIGGETDSSGAGGFPTVNAFQSNSGGANDAFVASLNAAGTALRYSTYLGGTGNEIAYGIGIDGAGAVAVTGYTGSSNFAPGSPLDATYGGANDAFVAKFDPSLSGAASLIYRTYLGGSGTDFGYGIALDSAGNAYVTGKTGSAYQFPSVNPRQPTSNGGIEAFVTKINPAGTALIYSTLHGGNGEDVGRAIAVDGAGRAYVAGWTLSSSLFPLVNALQTTRYGYDDAFVSAFSASGNALVYSTYLAGSSNDEAYGIAVDAAGNATVIGQTRSANGTTSAPSDFPIARAIQPTFGGGLTDAFVTTLRVDGGAVLASTYLGGSDVDTGQSVAVDALGSVFVTGYTASVQFPTANPLQATGGGIAYDAFVATISDPLLPNDLLWNPNEQGVCPCARKQVGGPIDSRSGNLWTASTDLAVASAGPALAWTRSYASQATGDTSGPLGAGWTHPYATRLITETMTGGEAGRVIVVSPLGNRWRFLDVGDGQFRAFPGVYSSLVRASASYTLTLRDQTQYVYAAATGTLASMRMPDGRRLLFSYTGTRLDQISDELVPQRFLALTYTGGRISAVSDGTRTVSYAYTNGDLTGVTDVMNRTTSYTYQNHLLTGIDNALGQAVERTSYDQYTPAGRATHQTLLDGRQLDLVYNADSTVVTTTGADGRQDVDEIFYDLNNTWTGLTHNGTAVQGAAYDAAFAPSALADGNGNVTRTISNALGQPLRVTDAQGHTSTITYDAQQHPTTVVDPLGRKTELVYDANNNLLRQTSGITRSFPLGFTTVYTYNVSYPAKNWLEAQRTADGVVTRYDYNPAGQVITTTLGAGTALAQVNTYGYDMVGRVITTTVGVGTSLQRRDVTHYNADDSVSETFQQYQDGVFDPAHPDQDIRTSYGYDNLGRRVWTRDALGRYDATHYDAAGRVDWTARNLAPLQLDSQGQPIFQAFSAAQPDANVAALYGYDGLNRTNLVTETGILTGTFNTTTLQFSATTTRTTRSEYDALSRPITTTLNYQPGVPAAADVNVQTITRYDNAGNQTWQRDALNRWMRSEYDPLNRPITTTLNYENGNPLTVDPANSAWTDGSDSDIRSVTRYTADGQLDRQIANYVDGAFTATQPITDRITLQQYDAVGRATTTTQVYDPPTLSSRTDTNRASATAYATTSMRTLGQQDALGRWSSPQYDALSRVTATIQNCRNAAGTAVATGCAAFSSSIPDRNVMTQTRYDALGRAFESVDPLSHVTHMAYDGAGRTLATTQNYVAGGPVNADTNVTTSMAYDVLGRTLAQTDPVGATARQSYDGLGQTVVLTDTMGRVTRMGYDGTGGPRWTKRPDGQLTLMQLDGLGRTVATITNYQDGVVGGSEPADQDLISRTVYDAAGRKTQAIDPADRATSFGYDQQDRLVSVIEHAVTGTCSAPPCNVQTRYQYDRAGNRTAIVDARSNTRRFTYDAADRQVSAIDALGRTTSWDYDRGGRTTKQRDPRATIDDLTYTYDDLDRRTKTETLNPPIAVTAQYDALGRRLSLGDSSGTTSFAYDALSRMTQVSAPNTGVVGSSYNARGERTQLTYPDATTIGSSYWADGQLRDVTQGATTLASYAYDTAGRLQSLTRSNGAVTTLTYDNADRLTDLRTTVSSTTRSRFQYTLDRLGQRTSVTETFPLATRTISYGYDGLLRLTSAVESPGTNYGYAYDLAGNRTSVTLNGVTTESRTYDAANQVSNTGWLYDAAGNLLSDGSAVSTYDAFSRPLTVVAGLQARANTYNGDGVLVSQISNSLLTRYTQDLAAPLSQILQTSQIAGVTTNYLYGVDRLASVTAGVRTWQVGDGLGSVRQTLSDLGVSLTTANYDPWGTPQTGSLPSTFGFTGELQDAATGLVYLRARWYATGQGRFGSRDPFAGMMARPQTLAQYPYAENDPVNKVDPSGYIAAFIAGLGNEDSAWDNKDVGVWEMARQFAGKIKGSTLMAAGVLSNNNIQTEIREKIIRSVTLNCQDKDKEPIILVGHSLGARQVMEIANSLAAGAGLVDDKPIQIDLVVTLDMVVAGDTGDGGGLYGVKPPNVRRQINLTSEELVLGGPLGLSISIVQRVDGAENTPVPNTVHGTIDNAPYSFNIVERAIMDVMRSYQS